MYDQKYITFTIVFETGLQLDCSFVVGTVTHHMKSNSCQADRNQLWEAVSFGQMRVSASASLEVRSCDVKEQTEED